MNYQQEQLDPIARGEDYKIAANFRTLIRIYYKDFYIDHAYSQEDAEMAVTVDIENTHDSDGVWNDRSDYRFEYEEVDY